MDANMENCHEETCETESLVPDNLNIIPGYNDIGVFSQDALQKVLLATKLSNDLPSSRNDDYDYYNSFSGFRRVMNSSSKKIINLMGLIMKHQDFKGRLEGIDLEELFEKLSDCNDSIMERIGIAIDTATGKRKKQEESIIITTVNTKDLINTSWNKKKTVQKSSQTFHLLAAKNILRPQLKFKEKIDNSSEPFVPIIKEKPHALKQLAIILEPTENGLAYSHPYQCEINNFNPPDECLNMAVIQEPSAVATTPLIFINKVDQIESFVEDLKNQKEIAVDLEHHSYRSFQGITCLMQISTREKDYLIDTLELRSDLQILNEVFTNPKIIKVFHGADKDIEWLQRDLGIYVVNMFDTGQASRVLNMAQYSLGYLLKFYFKIDVDKQYQLADWRIRPLPDEMINYAREDTHYLLHVYDRMKNELLEKGNNHSNLLLSVFQRSKAICEKRYFKPVFHEDSYLDLYKKSKKVFNSRQMYALQELYRWRDHISRVEDESIGFTLPNHMLLQIAENLPREQQGILACCNPIPPLVRQNLNELHKIVWRARELPLIKNATKELRIQVAHIQQQIDLDNPLHCPHDHSHDLNQNTLNNEQANDQGNVETLGKHLDGSFILVKMNPSISVFIDSNENSPTKMKKKHNRVQEFLKEYISPYESYQSVLVEKTAELVDKLTVSELVENQQTNSTIVVEKRNVNEGKRLRDGDDDDDDLNDINNGDSEKMEPETKKGKTIQSELPESANKLGKNGKKKKKKMLPAIPNFQSFDYSQVNYQNLGGGPKKKKNQKRKIYNEEPTVDYMTGSKPRKMNPGSCKSFTYSTKLTKHS